MDVKSQATQYSVNQLNAIKGAVEQPKPVENTNPIQSYFEKGVDFGRLEGGIANPVNWGIQFIEDLANVPSNIIGGAGDILQGRYLKGAGRVGQGIFDVATTLYSFGVAKAGQIGFKQAVKMGAKEGIKYGAISGTFQGLQQAEGKKAEEILPTIVGQTGLGAVTGGIFGGAIGGITKGVQKTYRYFKPEKPIEPINLQKTVDDLEQTKVAKVNKVPEKPKQQALFEVEGRVTPKAKGVDTSSKGTQFGKAVLKATDRNKVLPKVEPVIKNNTEKIIENIAVKNFGGAETVMRSLPESQQIKVRGYLKSVAEKGNFDVATKNEVMDFIQKDIEATYNVRPSKKIYDENYLVIKNKTLEEKKNDAYEFVDFAKQTLDQIRLQGFDPQQEPQQFLAKLLNRYPLAPNSPINPVDYFNTLAQDLSLQGESVLAKRIIEKISIAGTATGQISQTFDNTLVKMNRDAEALMSTVRGKVDERRSKVIDDASRQMNDELKAEEIKVLDDPNNQKELNSLVKSIEKDIELEESGSVDDVLESFKDIEDRRFIVSILNKEIEKLVPKTEDTFEISNKVRQLLLINKSELKQFQKTQKKEDKLFDILSYSFKNQDRLSNLQEEIKTDLYKLVSGDPVKVQIAEGIMRRNIPEVFTEAQATRAFRTLVKELKVDFKEIARKNWDSENDEYTKLALNDIKSLLLKKLDVSEDTAKNLINSIEQKFYSLYEHNKAKVKFAGQRVAERIQKDLDKIAGTESEQIKQDSLKAYVNNVYTLIKDEYKFDNKNLEVTNNGRRVGLYEGLKLALSDPKKHARILKEAQQFTIDNFQNKPEVAGILQGYLERVIGLPYSEKLVQKVAKDQLKTNSITINELIRKHKTVQDATLEDLERSFMNDVGVKPELARAFAKRVNDFIQSKMTDRRNEIIDKFLNPVIREPKAKADASKKIIELANIGIFDDLKTANIMAEKLNIPHLTEANRAFIAQKFSDIQTKPNYTYEDAIKDIGKNLAETNKINLMRGQDRVIAFDQYFYNNIFSGFQTQQRNIFGGLFNSIVVKNLTNIGEYAVSKIAKATPFLKNLPPEDLDISFKSLADYNKAYFGAYKQATDNFLRVWKDPNFIPKVEDPTMEYFYNEYKKKQLPAVLRQVGNFMQASDDFIGTLTESGTYAYLKSRDPKGLLDEKTLLEKAFLTKQELLGRAEIKRTKVEEVGAVDAFFDKLGNIMTGWKSKNTAFNYVMTPLFPVVRLAINFQKYKARLFPPTQLINILSKDPTNRKLVDYAYLSVGTATTAFAFNKFLNGEITFEAPKNEDEKKAFYDSGRKPYSVKIGDNWVPITYMELFGAPFLYLGAMQSAFGDDPEAMTDDVATKLADAHIKFIKSFFIQPTYLQVVSKILTMGQGYGNNNIGDVVSYASTGLVPFVGLWKDIVDIIDPIKRKKQESWDEFKSLLPEFRKQLEPYTSTTGEPVSITPTELYAPYGIGKVNQQYEDLYRNLLEQKQFRKSYQDLMKEETKRVETTQNELELAVLNKDYRKIEDLSRQLTDQQITSVAKKMETKYLRQTLDSESQALASMTENQLSFLRKTYPELSPKIDNALRIKETIVAPTQIIFDNLKEARKPRKKLKIRKLKAKKPRIKKVRAKKFRIAKPKKIKKIRPIKIA